jgi:NADH-quinone oxidoreductase subunit M
MNGFPIITILTLLPILGGVLVICLGDQKEKFARRLAFFCGLISLGLVLAMWGGFNQSSAGYQFEERHPWIPTLNVDYHLGVDGISLLMLLLTAIVTLMAVMASRGLFTLTPALSHPPRHPMSGSMGEGDPVSAARTAGAPGASNAHLYYGLILFLQAGLFGTFTALNFVHWFLFWELSLIPAFFLVRLWGGPRRATAATQFFVYTMVGSVGLLLSFLAIFLATNNFDFPALAEMARNGQIIPALSAKLGWPNLTEHRLAFIIFFGAFLGFAVKVPLMPFHAWLPSTYAEAPSPVTMLLTGAMSKMGVYGFIRILLPIFPEQMQWVRTPLLILAIGTIVLSASAAFAQRDLKRILAYSSINHLGYCLLAIFAVATGAEAVTASAVQKAAALNGAVLQMFNHGLTAATLFWFVSLLEQRSGGLRGLNDFGGIRKVVPVFCGLMGIALFSSLGLPGLNGFVGEFLIFKGVFPLASCSAAISVIGLLVTAIFILTILQRVFNGPLNAQWSKLPDLTGCERVMLAVPIALMFVLGVYPQLVLGVLNTTVVEFVKRLPF